MLPLCSDSWELMASNGFLHLHVFALVCVVVAVCYIAVPLVFFSAFFLFFSGAGVCNPILKRVKSICEENEVCKKKHSKKIAKISKTHWMWETECENYSQRRSFEWGNTKIESSSNNMCQKG